MNGEGAMEGLYVVGLRVGSNVGPSVGPQNCGPRHTNVYMHPTILDNLIEDVTVVSQIN